MVCFVFILFAIRCCTFVVCCLLMSWVKCSFIVWVLFSVCFCLDLCLRLAWLDTLVTGFIGLRLVLLIFVGCWMFPALCIGFIAFWFVVLVGFWCWVLVIDVWLYYFWLLVFDVTLLLCLFVVSLRCCVCRYLVYSLLCVYFVCCFRLLAVLMLISFSI